MEGHHGPGDTLHMVEQGPVGWGCRETSHTMGDIP